MSILLNNKILKATEQKIEAGLTPDARKDYDKIVVAGMRVALDGGTSGIMRNLKQSRDPVKDCANGAVNLVFMMGKQAKGIMPMRGAVPAAITLMLQALDVADRAGIIKVGAEEIDRGTKIAVDRIFAAIGVTPQMLNTAAGKVSQIMNDRDKMEIINRRVGAVKDPRASVPTAMPEGDEEAA